MSLESVLRTLQFRAVGSSGSAPRGSAHAGDYVLQQLLYRTVEAIVRACDVCVCSCWAWCACE
jgi:hypothetical protein